MFKFIGGFFNEFRKFAIKGNVTDMAVGIIIGAAFGKFIASLVGDIIMPPVGMLIGKVDFSKLAIVLDEETKTSIRYGEFLNNSLNFLIVAFCIFLVVRQMNRLKQYLPNEQTTKSCPHCLSSIPLKAKRCAFCTSMLEE
jgi:large conductance mechanosensitive channel